MKERYLFQGKSTHGVKWITGDLLVSTYSSGRVEYKIHERTPRATTWFVRPETIRQYIGRTDKQGHMVFEGDILKETFEDGDAEFLVVVWDDESSGFVLMDATTRRYQTIPMPLQTGFSEIEIIGNKWDNPDMISGEVWEVLK